MPPGDQPSRLSALRLAGHSRTRSHTHVNNATANAEHACENGGATYM